MTEEGWKQGADKKSRFYDDIEILIKGPEEKLPDGESYPDVICEEKFNPGTPLKTWKKTKEYNMEVSQITIFEFLNFFVNRRGFLKEAF